MSNGGSYIADEKGVTLVERTKDHEKGNRPRHADGTPVNRTAPSPDQGAPSDSAANGEAATAIDASRAGTKKTKE